MVASSFMITSVDANSNIVDFQNGDRFDNRHLTAHLQLDSTITNTSPGPFASRFAFNGS
jgi:hypothetical protein